MRSFLGFAHFFHSALIFRSPDLAESRVRTRISGIGSHPVGAVREPPAPIRRRVENALDRFIRAVFLHALDAGTASPAAPAHSDREIALRPGFFGCFALRQAQYKLTALHGRLEIQ